MICQTLIAFARQREKAFRFTGTFTGDRARSVTRIKQVADYWKGRDEGAAVRQAKAEIECILPAPNSRFQKQRQQIISLLNTYL